MTDLDERGDQAITQLPVEGSSRSTGVSSAPTLLSVTRMMVSTNSMIYYEGTGWVAGCEEGLMRKDCRDLALIFRLHCGLYAES